MKKLFIVILTLTFFLATTAFATETDFAVHQLLVSYENLNLRLNTDKETLAFKGRRNLSGIQLGYEYLQPIGFYAGFDLLSAASGRGESAQDNPTLFQSIHRISYSNLDFRFGYSNLLGDLSITPYLGGGTTAIGSISDHRGFDEGCVYLSTGVRSLYTVNTAFSFGLNLKGILAGEHEMFKNAEHSIASGGAKWGATVGLPMVWNFNKTGSLTFQLEPWYSQLPFSGYQSVLGSKFLVGAHF